MQKLGAYIVITIAVFAVAAVTAWQGGRTSANVEESSGPAQGSPTAAAQGHIDGGGATTTHPFVGIAIETLGPAEALELDVAGGAVVWRVLPHGPSAGLLLPHDTIIAIGGAEVAGAEIVIEAVRASKPGDVLTFTVLRGEETLVIDVTVGERPVRAKRHHRPVADLYHRLLNHIWGWQDRLASFEVTLETDDGFKTFRAVVGKASDIDVENGTFVLTPKDGSDPIHYVVSTSTRVIVGHTGDLGGLNTADVTLVVEMDGVKLVLQGDLPPRPRINKPHQFGPKSGLHGPARGRHGRFRGPHGPSDFREHLQRVLPSTPFQGFEGGQLRVPPELRERLRETFTAIPFERFEDEAPQRFRFPPEVRELRGGLSQDL